MADAEAAPAAATTTGMKGMPTGITANKKKGTPTGTYQVRVTYTPMGVKQRGLGSFRSIEEAAAAYEAAMAQLKAGTMPWDGEARKNTYARGEVSLLAAAAHGMHAACMRRLADRCESAHAAQAPPPAKRTKAAASVADKRDPTLPTSVPLPKDVIEVNNVHVATLLADGVRVAAQPAAGAPAGAAEPAPSQH